MRNKLLNNNLTNSISKGGVLYRAGELPDLTKEQINQANLVRKLPADFPFANWESMNTKQQLQQMRYSGLNDQDQWSLLNTNVPLSVLDQHNQVQDEVETRASATRIATTLMNAVAQATIPRMQAAVGKPTVSTPLQTTAQQRKLDMKQEEYETRFYEKQARHPIVVNTPNDTPKTPEGEKPVVDSRDAMEQKKDKLWEKVEGTYSARDAMDRKKDGMWEKEVVPTWRDKREDTAWDKVDTTDKNPPTKLPSYLKKYQWYDSYDKAANAWANFNRPFSKELERCALIYQYTDIKGNQYYTYGETKIGMDEIPELGIRDNVVFSLLDLLFRENVFHSKRIGFVHTHPDLPGNDQFSTEDSFVYLAPGIDFKSVAPYGKKGVKTE